MLLVTGITGHTGRWFFQELVKNNYKGTIRCIVRESSNTTILDHSGLDIEMVMGNLEDQEFVEKTMVGVEVVMHIYNIHHSPSIIQAAIKYNVKRAILVHTTGIYSQFKSASEGYKNIEKIIYKLFSDPKCTTSITILRPTMIYGDLCDRNVSKFIKLVDKLRVIPVINSGNSLIQPVNARDLGAAYFTVLMTPEKTAKKIYDLSGDKPIKLIDLYKLISKELKKKTTYMSIPLNIGVFITMTLKILTFGKVDYIEKVQRMGEDRSYPHDNARNDFGFNPMTIEEGIKIEVQEYLRRN